MSNQNYTRFSNSTPQPTSAGTTAKPSYILRRAKSLDTGGSRYPSREGSCNQHTQPSATREFLLNFLPNTHERGSDETSNKPQEIERIGGALALEDGGCSQTDRVPHALYHITFEPARGETSPHQVGGEPDPTGRSGDSMSASSSDRETACNISN